MLKISNNKITIYKGDSGSFAAGAYDETGTPYEMKAGDSLTFKVRADKDSEPIFTKPVSEGNVTITPEDTADMDYGEYIYDLVLTTEQGTVDTVIGRELFEVI